MKLHNILCRLRSFNCFVKNLEFFFAWKLLFKKSLWWDNDRTGLVHVMGHCRTLWLLAGSNHSQKYCWIESVVSLLLNNFKSAFLSVSKWMFLLVFCYNFLNQFFRSLFLMMHLLLLSPKSVFRWLVVCPSYFVWSLNFRDCVWLLNHILKPFFAINF